MNKLFTKIATAFVGMAMAIGVGVAVANNREVKPVQASTDTRDWDLVTDASKLAANDIITFVTGTIDSKRYVTTNITNATGLSYLVYDSTSVTVTNNVISGLDAITHGFMLSGSSTAWKITTLTENTASNSAFIGAWLYKTGTSNNIGLTKSSTQTGVDWTIGIDSSSHIATVKNGQQKSNKDMIVRYNKASGDQRFACYQYDTQEPIYLFKARAAAQTPTITFESSGSFSAYSNDAFTVSGTYSNLTGTPTYTITSNSDKVSNLNWTAGDGAFSLTGTANTVNTDTTVSITVANGTEASATGTLTIHPAEVTSVTLDLPKKHLVGINSTFTLTATIEGHGGYSQTVTWTSSDADVATVSNGVVTAKGSGLATITATGSNDKKATCTVVVTKNDGTTKAKAFEAGEARLLVLNGLHNTTDYFYVKGYVRENTGSSYYNIYLTTTNTETYTSSADGRKLAFELYRPAQSGEGVVDPSTVKSGDFINARGKLKLYSGQAEFDSGCTIVRELVSLSYEGTPVEQHTGVAFNPDGLTFTGTFDDASTKQYYPSDLTFTTPDTAGENKTVTATVTGTEISVTITGLTVTDIHATSVTLQATGEVIVGKTLELEYSVSPAGYVDTVTFTSSAPAKATVTNEGVVTGVAETSEDITITLSTSNGLSATCSLSVTTGALRLNAKYLIASFTYQTTVFKNVEKVGSTTNAGSVETYSHFVEHDYAVEVKAGSEAGYFAFLMPNGKYITGIDDNKLDFSDTVTDLSSWNVTKNNDGSYTVQNKSLTARYLQFNYNNGSSSRFACYKDTQEDPIFMPLTDKLLAGSFVQKYMQVDVETSVKGSGDCITEGWYDDAVAAFFTPEVADENFHLNAAQRLEVKNSYADYYLRLQNWAIANGHTIDVNEGGTDIILNSNVANILVTNGNDNIATIVVIISIIGITFIGGYFFIRKRKEQ